MCFGTQSMLDSMIPCCVRESLDFSTRDIVETPTPDGPNTITKDCRPQATTVPGPTRDTIVRSSAESLAVRADRYHYVLSATAHPTRRAQACADQK